jgi:BirA family biotin operon repressor/biotin-[acetyl-CoA-carboxylase] ligase
VAAPLVAAMLAFERDGFAPFQARFAARDALAGRAVRLSDGTEGNACGVGPQGALRVQTAAGMRDISSQEVSVRPLAAAQPPFATVGTNRL